MAAAATADVADYTHCSILLIGLKKRLSKCKQVLMLMCYSSQLVLHQLRPVQME